MKAILRVALTYFTFSPVQAWVSLIGLLLIAFGAIVQIVMQEPGGLALSMLGAALLALGPFFGGGIMMRQLSCLRTMSLRPGVQLRLLLGTTLAMLIIVLAVTLPFLLMSGVSPGGKPLPAARTVFYIAWGVLALDWAGTFTISATRALPLFWVFPVLAIPLLTSMSPEQLPDPVLALVAGVVLWGVFAGWYLRQRMYRPVAQWVLGGPPSRDSTPAATSPAQARQGPPPSAPQARRQWLWGHTSFRVLLAVGMGHALLIVVLFTAVLDSPARGKSLLGNILYFGVMMTCFISGHALVGRSRLLWLRAGLTRSGLLRHAETCGLLPALVTFLGAALVIVTTQWIARPDLLATIFLNALAQLSLGLCLVYWGMSFTHEWSVGTVIEVACGFVLWLVATIMLGPIRSPSFLMGSVAALALLALLLRVHAHRRWRNLDWRVKRPQLNAGWAMRPRT